MVKGWSFTSASKRCIFSPKAIFSSFQKPMQDTCIDELVVISKLKGCFQSLLLNELGKNNHKWLIVDSYYFWYYLFLLYYPCIHGSIFSRIFIKFNHHPKTRREWFDLAKHVLCKNSLLGWSPRCKINIIYILAKIKQGYFIQSNSDLVAVLYYFSFFILQADLQKMTLNFTS